ncbi:AAA family ATPase [Ectothiorhodospiraceae bacterium 2226]|nr:AAA family ATPase [Ectothiorhodospiraceae bacterium 2226]
MASRVIAVVNQKGGTGKTTLSMNLAAGLSRRGRTLVVDADPQGSATQWARLSSESKPYPASVVAVAGPLGREVARFRDDYRYVVVDCPPTLESGAAQAAMGAADLVLIPVLPSPMDLWGSVRMAKALDQARTENDRLAAYLVVNQVEMRNALSRAMEQALAEFDIPALESKLQRRAVYRNTALEGSSVYEYGKRGEAAAAEIDALIEEAVRA